MTTRDQDVDHIAFLIDNPPQHLPGDHFLAWASGSSLFSNRLRLPLIMSGTIHQLSRVQRSSRRLTADHRMHQSGGGQLLLKSASAPVVRRCGSMVGQTTCRIHLKAFLQRITLNDMNHSSLKVSIIVTCLAVAACSQPPDRINPVGRSFAPFVDDERESWDGKEKRPLATTIWYPAVAGARESEWRIGVFRAGWTAPEADIVDRPQQLPLVILSHGTGAAAAQLSWLAEYLASNGYLVAAVNHHGNTAAEEEYSPQGFVLWWERARDISVVIDKLLADSRFAHRIDASRIGVAGFSLGGYTAVTTAGALTDRNQWRLFCSDNPADPGCSLPPESPFSRADFERLAEENDRTKASIERSHESYRDERVRSVYAIAPVLVPALDRQSLGEIEIPVRIVVGDRDDQAVPAVNARPLAVALPVAELQVLPRVAHYTFLATCSFKGRRLVGQLCEDPHGTDRHEVHQKVGADALAFFNRTLSKMGSADKS